MEELLASLVILLITAPIWALTIALGIRWGGMWLLKAIAKEVWIEQWLKRIFNPTER